MGHILQGHGDVTHCAYCGRTLNTGYFIKVFSCTFSGETDDDINDDGTIDCSKNLYDEKLIVDLSYATGLSFPTAKERDAHFDQHMKSNFAEPVSPTYEEIDHFLIMFGTHTTKGDFAMGRGTFKKYAGQTVEERACNLSL